MKKDFSKYLWGVLLILLGVFVLLRSFGAVSQSIFFTGWWTLFIIIPSLINLIFAHNKIADASILVLGISLFFAANKYISYDNVAAIAVCLLLVNIGLSIIINKKKRPQSSRADGNYVGVFGGCKEKPNNFTGGNAIAVFGGVDLDLRDVVFEEDTYLTAVSIFGGIDIIVNDNVNIEFSTINIFGGCENKQAKIEGNKTLFIDGAAVFGGIDIKSKP